MLINTYFNTPVKLKIKTEEENDMNLPTFSEEKEIYVRADGQAGLRYSGSKVISSTDYVYLTLENIPLGSTINEMPVKNVEIIYEFNGSISHYEVIAGPAG